MNPPPGVDAVFHAEIDRLARKIVTVRAARALWGYIPLLVIVAFQPTLFRSFLILGVGSLLVLVFRREPERLVREGFSVRFISENARILATAQAMLLLTTGGLASPFLPLLVLFPLAVTLILGADPSLRPYLIHQFSIVLFLITAQLLGWAAFLSPTWIESHLSLEHTLVSGGSLLLMVNGASRVGGHLREMFDRIVGRVAVAQNDLLHAHRVQAEELTALSGSIAHELKNPLASVKGLAGLLSRDLQEGKPAERLAVLREEVDRMQGILEEFLTFSRPLVPTVLQSTDLRNLIDAVSALHEGLARGKGQRILTAGTGVAQLDPRKTRQILINLLQNALEASPPAGQVRMTVIETPTNLEILVEDEGTGPDEELGARLFVAGVTTKPSGNGLGLTIARALARQQGGDVVLEKRIPQGAVARLRLPREAA